MNQATPGQTSSTIVADTTAHLTYLCNAIGPRLIGSPQNLAAGEYIEQILQAAQLQTQRQAFACPAWSVEDTYLSVGGERLAALANTFSPSCDVNAPMLAVGTVSELEAADVTNQVCLMYGDLTKEPLSGLSNLVYVPAHHRKIAQLLLAKQPAAVITISMTPEYPLLIIEDWDLPIPSLTVPAEVGLVLLQQRDQAAHVNIVTRREHGRSYNIVGMKTNTGRNRIILCAHYDTKHGTPGAFDNGSGIAVLLTLAKLLAPLHLSVDLEFIAFSGEEYGLGGDTYLRQHGLHTLPFGQQQHASEVTTGLGAVIAAINIDGVGQHLGTNAIGMLACSAALQALIADIMSVYPSMITIDPGPASNHYDFYTHGVPSIVASSVALGNVLHHTRDTLAWMSAEKLSEVISFVQRLVERLQDKSPAWGRIGQTNS